MLRLMHWLIVIAYLTAPVLALIFLLFTRGRRRATRVVSVITIAIVFGSAMAFSCAIAAHGRVSAIQVFLCIYFTASLIVLVGAFDRMLLAGLRRAWKLARTDSAGAKLWRKTVEALPVLLRATLLVVLLIPYLIATALTYQPKVLPQNNPGLLGMDFQRVQFDASDHLTIRGWWMPASAPVRRSLFGRSQARGLHRAGRDTVVLCHGLGSNKSELLDLAGAFAAQGYNVLLFDFRGHGESDGEFTTLGDLERRDVLGAVRWVRENHPKESKRILGLGVSTGAAALIEAAADPSRDGQAIDALAVVEAFDDLGAVARSAAQARFLPPLSWIADRVALPLASAQVGADLVHFAPANDVKQIWPRPILVVHGMMDSIIPFDHGQRLYDAALEPRRCFWQPDDDYDRTMQSPATFREIRDFFDEARAVPAI